MNTNGHTIRQGFAAFTAATAFFAFAACGTEISPPTQDIGGTQQKQTKAPEQPAKTDPARQDFDDDYGTPTIRSEPPSDAWTGIRPGMDFGA